MIINLISIIGEKYDEIYFFLYKEEKMLINKHFEKHVDFINKVIEKKDFKFKSPIFLFCATYISLASSTILRSISQRLRKQLLPNSQLNASCSL